MSAKAKTHEVLSIPMEETVEVSGVAGPPRALSVALSPLARLPQTRNEAECATRERGLALHPTALSLRPREVVWRAIGPGGEPATIRYSIAREDSG